MKPFMKKPARGECWPILRYTRFARTSADASDSYGGQAGPLGQRTCHVVASAKTDRTMRARYCMLFLVSLCTTCLGTVTFNNATSKLFIDTTNSKLAIANPSKVSGWGQYSVVKAFGDNASNSWVEGYSNNTIIGQTGQSGVTNAACTTMVDANSNAINTNRSPLRTTSNLLLYTARTYSSSIVVLRSRADSTSRDMRTTSNAVNMFYNNLAVPTTDSIDGTQFMRYHTAHHVFHNGASTIRGWVRFNNGFTIMPQATVLMDTLTTVSGPIDLRDTGVLSLNNDLYLAHNVTLTAGGYIEGTAGMGGQANTIFMGGDLTIANDNYAKVLHITGNWQTNANSGDLVIDGCGHTLNIGSQAQIFVDQNVTLTLRNMTIKTSPASLMKPAIQLASMGSKLALDNVLFDLGADFQFDQGQIFIHDEVAVTGTSAFVYQSPKPSYITSGATWSFETGTTFSIAPSTYTDQPFTAGTATSNNFIVLADQSSALSLNNCSLKTTFTGARFTKGMVLFDNKVALDTQAGSEVSGLGSGVGLLDVDTTVSCASFSPDGRYVAVTYINSGNAWLSIQRFNGTSALSFVANSSFGTAAIPTVAWSPDGKFIATGIAGYFYIFRFNGSALSSIITPPSFGLLVNSISWSPDGRYLAVAGNNGTTPVIVYRFDGTTLTQVATANPTGGGTCIQVNGVAWSQDGRYLLIANRTTVNGNVYAYSFNGSTFTGNFIVQSGLGAGICVTWSPDSRFIAAGWNNSVNLWRFNGSSATSITIPSFGTQINAVSFSPDGRYLLACGANGAAGIYGLYRVSLSGATLVGSTNTFATVATTVAWSPDSKYALVGGTNGTTDLIVFPVTRTATSATTQGFSNGLLFGDKIKGSNFDTNVQVLGGAVVKVKGMVKDDSF